ncbi:hypothetical protein QQF64_035689, partial [Cirrhinus molitorella]
STLNEEIIKPPYENQVFKFESSGGQVNIYIKPIRSFVSLTSFNNLLIKLAMEHFHNNTQGQCGICGGQSCIRRNGVVEDDNCCDKTAYDWVVEDPSKPYCQSALTNVPCIPPSPPPPPPPPPPCNPTICDLLHHEVFAECGERINLTYVEKNCQFDYCSYNSSVGACSSLEYAASECRRIGICVNWRYLTNGYCEITCPEGMVYDECRESPNEVCRDGVRMPATSVVGLKSGCFCPDNQILANEHKEICVPECTPCKGPLGEPMPVGAVWESNCHICTCNNQTRTEECIPKPQELPPVCSAYSILVSDCCDNQICVEKSCEYNGRTYKVGERWTDPSRPCESFSCSQTGTEVEKTVCPLQTCAEDLRVWDEHHCCYSCNVSCTARLTRMNVTISDCTQEVELPICEGQCETHNRWVHTNGTLQLEQSHQCCKERGYEMREITLTCSKNSPTNFTYRHVTGWTQTTAKGIMSVEKKTAQEACCSKLKMFLAAMCFVYFAKAFQGSYMKSSVTQIERRFDIPSSLIGFIDGSFEIGNLLVIAFVSYFGAKLHRPRLIGAGCLIMAIGSFLTATPRFFQGPYKYETTISHFSDSNGTESFLPCLTSGRLAQDNEIPTVETQAECEKAASSSLWLYVFLGNMLRGVGETPVMPLGLSYLDDFSREENTAFYIALIQTVGMIGPMFGFMLGSFCAKLYVDIGAVDLDTITINYKDSRWVGAWWLGFLLTGGVMLLAGIPFWFLPKSLPKQGETESEEKSNVLEALAKDFLPSMKKLFSNSIYLLLVCTAFVQVNGFIGMITFKPKFMEQIYGQSASRAIFLIGIMNLPAVALGIVTGGFIMKKFKLNVVGASKVCIGASILAFCTMLIQYFLQCDNSQVAGLTVSYQGAPHVSYQPNTLISSCNMGCSCSLKHWDPICASNGLTYASPCLAGCQTSTGDGRNMVFHNCTCIGESPLPFANMSAVLGQCPRKSDCDHMFKFYMTVTVIGAFISACGATPGYIILLRSINQELKSLAIGIYMLIVRTLGGIPPPIYFGAFIDRTCLKWGTKQCGGRGACRIYESGAFRNAFLGLIYGLYSLSYVLWGILYVKLSRREKKLALKNQLKAPEPDGNGVSTSNGNVSSAIVKCSENPDQETTI